MTLSLDPVHQLCFGFCLLQFHSAILLYVMHNRGSMRAILIAAGMLMLRGDVT